MASGAGDEQIHVRDLGGRLGERLGERLRRMPPNLSPNLSPNLPKLASEGVVS